MCAVCLQSKNGDKSSAEDGTTSNLSSRSRRLLVVAAIAALAVVAAGTSLLAETLLEVTHRGGGRTLGFDFGEGGFVVAGPRLDLVDVAAEFGRDRGGRSVVARIARGLCQVADQSAGRKGHRFEDGLGVLQALAGGAGLAREDGGGGGGSQSEDDLGVHVD